MEIIVTLLCVLTVTCLTFTGYLYYRHLLLTKAFQQTCACLSSINAVLMQLYAQDQRLAEEQQEFVKRGDCN